jgi:hypothetical protein
MLKASYPVPKLHLSSSSASHRTSEGKVLPLSSAAAKPKTKTKKEKAVVPSLPLSSSPKSDD